MTKTLNTPDLAQFIGSENWYRHAINRAVGFTDGAKFVADQAGAYWLLDEIAIIQAHNARVAAEAFQVWKLAVNADQTGVLTCDDGNGRVIFRKQIEYTDFPLDGVLVHLRIFGPKITVSSPKTGILKSSTLVISMTYNQRRSRLVASAGAGEPPNPQMHQNPHAK
jgi:hypothetical protein